MINRMIGALRLDVHTFEDVENDESALGQAVLVVVIVAIASAIGGLLSADNLIQGLIFGIIYSLVSWALWALITYVIGTTILKTPETHATWSQLARTTAFAQSPGLFRIFAFIPLIGGVIVFIAFVWQLTAMVIAVRQALDYQSTWRAVGVVLIGFIVVIIPVALISQALGII
ncbi:MAG: YIP1 family protein [Dehalococcoidia bacterium]